MPYSSGTFSLYTPGNPVVTGTTIASTWANNTLNDISTGLTTALLKDGTQTVTANIPMSSFKFTGLGAGTTAGNSLRYEQVYNASGITLIGDLLFTDASFDIGKTGATRPRDGFFSRNLTVGGTASITGHVTLEGVTSTGATGTGLLVFGTGPTISLASASTGTTQTALDNSTKLATTAYVDRGSSGASWVLLASSINAGAVASATLSGITSTYDEHVVLMTNVIPATDGANFQMLVGDGGGLKATAYQYHFSVLESAVATYASLSSTSDTQFALVNDVSGTHGLGFGMFWLSGFGNSGAWKNVNASVGGVRKTGLSAWSVHGDGQWAGGTGALTQVNFKFSAGNLTGNFYLFGVRKA